MINSDLLIKNNKITKNNKKIKNNLILKVSAFILSETNEESEVLIEISKTVEIFILDENYIINVDLLEITNETIWKII